MKPSCYRTNAESTLQTNKLLSTEPPLFYTNTNNNLRIISSYIHITFLIQKVKNYITNILFLQEHL